MTVDIRDVISNNIDDSIQVAEYQSLLVGKSMDEVFMALRELVLLTCSANSDTPTANSEGIIAKSALLSVKSEDSAIEDLTTGLIFLNKYRR